jgi:hypothetical protein
MTALAPVEIELNLLNYEDQLKRPADYLRFWDQLSTGLQGNKLVAGKTHFLESHNKGKIGLTIIAVPQGFSVVTKDTRFAIHSVLEQPNLRYKCSVCRSYGPFRCGEKTCDKRLCDQHAVILDGNMRAYCPEHAPKCKGSGTKATFWCDGPRCRGRVAWSDTYRVRHPNDPDHWYCPDCYALEFPPCSIQTCEDTGTTRCEYIYESTGESCNRSLCNKHVKRWQIYGPHKLGVALCSEHANIKQQTERNILYQMVVVTVKRNSKRRRYREYLPSLMSIRHIFINAKNEVYDPVDINHRLDRLEQEFRASNGKFAQDMAKLIQQSKPRRKQDIDRFGGQQLQGQTIFRKLQEKLVLQGEDIVVANLRFSDYRPRNKLLFIYLDQQYRGRLIGRGGTKIKQLQQELDVRIKFEDK